MTGGSDTEQAFDSVKILLKLDDGGTNPDLRSTRSLQRPWRFEEPMTSRENLICCADSWARLLSSLSLSDIMVITLPARRWQVMDCPFCAEQIKDAALVCPHCGRDLTFFRPVIARLEAMEKRLASLENNVANEPTADPTLGVPLNTWRLPTLAVVLTSFISVLSYGLSLPMADSPPLLLTSIFCPLPIAGLLGYMTTRRMRSEQEGELLVQSGMRGFLILGLAAGVLTFGGILALAKLRGDRVITSDFWPAATMWILGSVVLFAAGGFVGRWLGKRGEYDQYSWTARVANKLVTRRVSGGNRPGQRDEQVKRLAAYLSALAPILTLIGSIITGYFTYLAAAAKGK